MNRPCVFGWALSASILVGCAADTQQGPVGFWQYDKLSLRELAAQSAVDSVSQGEATSPEERAAARAWALEQHEGWNKTLEIRPDGTYTATSQIGEGQPESIQGTWSFTDGVVTLTQSDGQNMGQGRIEGDRLVLEMTDDEGVTAQMVMLAAGGIDR